MRYLCVFRLLETNSVNLDVLWDHSLLFQITMSNWCYVELLGCCFHLIFHLLVNHICLFLNRSSFYLIVFTIFWFFLVKVLNLLDLNLNRLWQSLFQITHVCILHRRELRLKDINLLLYAYRLCLLQNTIFVLKGLELKLRFIVLLLMQRIYWILSRSNHLIFSYYKCIFWFNITLVVSLCRNLVNCLINVIDCVFHCLIEVISSI